MHVGIAYLQWRGKRSRHSRCMHTRNFVYLARGPCRHDVTLPISIYNITSLHQTILWWTYHRYRWLTRCLLPQSLRRRHNCHQIYIQHFQINFLVWKIYFDLDLLKSVANGPVDNNNKSTLYQILFSRIVIIWINGGLVYSRLYASPGLNGLASPLWTFQPLQGYHCLTISSAK